MSIFLYVLVNNISIFTLATQGVSAVFAVATCLDVCLSVTLTRRYCVQAAEPILKLFGLVGSPIILVFLPLRRYPISRGISSAGAPNTRLGEKILRISTEIAVYLGSGTS